MPHLPRGLHELAARQHGMLGTAQLHRAGMTNSRVHDLVTHGILIPLARDVHRIAGSPQSERADLWATIAARPGAVVSHDSAARLHGLGPVMRPTRPHITVGGTASARTSIATVHRSDLPAGHVGLVADLPCTTVERTLIDLAGRLREQRLMEVLDRAVVTDHRTTYPAVSAALVQIRTRGRRGIAALRRLLDEHQVRPTGSAAERLLDQVIARAQVPPPLKEVAHPVLGEPTRVDRYFPRARLIVEADSRSWHDRRQQSAFDAERDSAAVAHGYLPLRLRWERMSTAPDQCAAEVAMAYQHGLRLAAVA